MKRHDHRLLPAFWLLLVLPILPVGAAPPDAPALVTPADEATGVPASAPLAVDVTDPDGDPLTVTFFGREEGQPALDFTIVALPDTQHYVDAGRPHFRAQTEWIVANKDVMNIAYVAHLGDCVENGDFGGNDVEWLRAEDAIGVLEDPFTTMLADGLPYGIAVGNHDQSPFGNPGTTSDEGATTGSYNSFFGVSRFQSRGYYGGHYGLNNDNHYDLFSASGMDFIVLYLEYDAAGGTLGQNVLTWADGVIQAHDDRRAIIVSHYIIQQGEQGAFGPQGQAIYDAMKDNPNVFLMLGGHRPGEGKREDTFGGRKIDTLLADYQSRANGGDGWLRVLRFSPAADEIYVETYSPTLDQYETDSDSEFDLDYEMVDHAPFVELASAGDVPSGGSAGFDWTGRSTGIAYEWQVEVADGGGETAGPVWRFTSDGSCSAPADCEDGDVCTDHACAGGFCQDTADPLCCNKHFECSDSDACTDDYCVDNTCDVTAVDCDDVNDCTDDTCDTGSGCQNVVDDTNSCNDAIACTVNDRCASGLCIADDVCPSGEACNVMNGMCEILAGDPLPVDEGEVWRYFKGTEEPPSDWNTLFFDDFNWPSGPSGFGYGDGDDNTVLADMKDNYISVYARHVFEVPDPARVVGARLYVDYDDGFVAYLNGSEIARGNMVGNPPGFSRSASGDHEAGTPSLYNLDPFLYLLNAGGNVFAVQGHNESIGSSDFSLIPEILVTCQDADACTSDVWDPAVGCVHSCDDGDPCTESDGCDSGGDCLGLPVAPTPEINHMDLAGGNQTTVLWTDMGPGYRYDVATGTIVDMVFVSGPSGAACLADDESVPHYADPRPDPLPNEGYYYMVRAQNDCAGGSYGTGSGGSLRLPFGACP